MLSRKEYSKSQKLELLRKLHMIAWLFGALLSLYCLLRCIAALDGAMKDFSKFRDLGFSRTFHCHLQNNGFYREIVPLLGVGLEWFHFSLQFYRADKYNQKASSIWIFSFLLIVHITMWLNSRVLPLPDLPAWELVDFPVVQYRRFANMTILPSIIYFMLYLLRIRSVDS